MNQPLFRREVLAEKQTGWLGPVLLAPRMSHRLFTLFAVITAAAILGLLFFGSYTRKARVNGWLVPQQGVMRVSTPQAGVVTELQAREGSHVRKGMPLLVISTELQSATLGATQEEIARRLSSRHDSLVSERGLQLERYTAQKSALENRLAALRAELGQIDAEIELQRVRVRLAETSANRQRQVRERGFVSEEQVQQAEQSKLDYALKLQDLERTRAGAERERVAMEGELSDLPLRYQAQKAELERSISALEQELAETEARRKIVIPAPQDGTVTGIQAELGSNANVSVPLLSIVPDSSTLDAQLFSPSRAIGFVRPGQRVLLRYQAYPYQKFGHYEGEVASISRSAVSPEELPPQMSGLSNLYGSREPFYRITVNLARQSVTAYGEVVPLQPGMLLEADVVLERRRLVEWMLEPLYTLTGKWH
jgi:membrane fusion protein